MNSAQVGNTTANIVKTNAVKASAIKTTRVQFAAITTDSCEEDADSDSNASSLLPYTELQALGLDTDKALSLLMGRDELYAKVLRRFVQERADLPQQLDAALQQCDYAAAGMLVHSLKSLAATIGADALQKICTALEQAFYAQCMPSTEIENFNREVRRLLNTLRALLIT